MASASLLRSFRLIHLYLGIFITPALLFFAFTGALQTFGLHEATRGSSYVPPQWAVVLGQIHKKQTANVPVRKPAPPIQKTISPPTNLSTSNGGKASDVQPTSPAQTTPARHALPLKLFFLLVSLGLLTSSLTGIYMAFKFARRPGVVLGLLIAGTVIPIALVFA